MLLSIIIVNYNQKYFPKLCIEAIKNAQIKENYEIIVVDNDSKDESIKYLEKSAEEGEIKLIKAGINLGYGKGNNIGVRNSKGEYILVLNPDVFIEKGSIEELIKYLKNNPTVGIIGPKLTYHDGTVQDSCRRLMSFSDLVIKRTFLKKLPFFKNRLGEYLMTDFNHAKIKEVDLLCGPALMLKKEVYEQVKGFDPRYFLFMEDFDLCREIKKKDLKVIYYPLVNMEHHHKRLSGGSTLSLLKKKIFWIHILSAIKYFWKWRKG